MKEENYLEGIYGCLERIEKKVETLPVEGTSPAVGNRTSSPEGIAELKIRLERLQSAVEKNGLEIAAVRNHTVRLSEGWPLSAETFAGEMEKIRYCLSQDCQAVKETVRRLDERMVLLKKEPERRLVTYRLESASKAVVTTASALILALIISVWTNCNQYRTNRLLKDADLKYRKRLLNYILCIRFFIEVHSIVSASRFFHMPTYLRVVIECQSRFFPFFPAFSRNCPDYFLHTSGSSSFRSLSDLGAR